MTIVAVIPARGGSKRFPGKNLQILFGKPLIVWSIEACQRSQQIDDVFVSSEDPMILGVAEAHGVGTIPRPGALADDETPKIEAIRHADQWLREKLGIAGEIFVSVQANSPEIRANDIDRGIDLLRRFDRWEVFSIDRNDVMNGAFRILRADCIHNTFLSSHMGVVRADYIDIHTQADLDVVVGRYQDAKTFTQWKQGEG